MEMTRFAGEVDVHRLMRSHCVVAVAVVQLLKIVRQQQQRPLQQQIAAVSVALALGQQFVQLVVVAAQFVARDEFVVQLQRLPKNDCLFTEIMKKCKNTRLLVVAAPGQFAR